MKVSRPRHDLLGLRTAVYAVAASAAIVSPSRIAAAEAAAPTAVRDSGEIWEAINKAKPGQVVKVAPGVYTPLKLYAIRFPGGDVTVTSADPAHPATIKGLTVMESEGIVFTHLDITVNSTSGFAVTLNHSSKIKFSDVTMRSVAVGDGNAAMVRDSSEIAIENSEIHHLGTGINHLNSDHIEFIGNSIHDIQSDGIRGGGSSFVTIDKNRFTDFYPKPDDHPDAIQFWTRSTKGPTHDLQITNNTYVRGRGDHIQGIFVGNEDQIPFENVTISGNAIIGGMYHGITIFQGNHIVVSGNVVQGYDDMNSWIMITTSTNSSISNNQATTYQLDNKNDHLAQSGNKQIRPAKVGDASILKSLQRP
jgi:hypothetical protein